MTAINNSALENNQKAEAIYEAHKAEFLKGALPHTAPVRRFKDKAAVADALIEGELFPEIWKQVAHHVLTPYQVIGLYSLLQFSSDAAERKFKASFIACVENLLSTYSCKTS